MDLIKEIMRDLYCVGQWFNLLAFGAAVLVKTRRGDRKHNITNTILSRVADCRLKGPSHLTTDEPDLISNQKPKAIKYDPEKYLASSVASKLEESNFKTAIRLICSEDKSALDKPETLAALKYKNPPAPSDRRTPCDPDSSDRFNSLQVSTEEVAI